MAEASATPLVRVRGLRRRYRRRGRLGSAAETIQALDGADLDVPSGSLLAVVGPSGSGKSTLARCLAGLERPDSGEILFEGRPIASLAGPELATHRRRAQLVFQDPSRALSPRMTVGEILCEPPRIVGRTTRLQQLETAHTLLGLVGLSHDSLLRRAVELSGGQRQRLAIARALTLEPALLILDESLSGLDLSLQAQIVNLLLELRESRGLTLIVVSHDLGLVARVADRIAVVQQGRTVEEGEATAVLAAPQAPLTRALVAEWRRIETRGPAEAQA